MKPIKRFTDAALIHRELKAPLAIVKCDGIGLGDCLRTSRVKSVDFNEDGTLKRIETLNSIYVQVKP
ncbi:hypothetical protein 20Sep420_00030 [Pseudomonas phage 20Sep420]|nr:hypothetical protein 20Sep420_00030 [Pseudomonas phage 20Sep420]